MDTPIINPILIYLADTASEIKWLLWIFGAAMAAAFLVIVCVKCCFDEHITKDNLKIAWYAFVVCAIGVIIPSTKTCYKMGISKYVTPETIEIVSEYIDDIATNINDTTMDNIKKIMDYTVDFVYDIRKNEPDDEAR